MLLLRLCELKVVDILIDLLKCPSWDSQFTE